MNLRRRTSSERSGPSAARPEPRTETCPHCGHVATGLEGRILDPTTGRAVCVRCGAEVGGTAR